MEEKKEQMNIEISEEIADVTYANLAIISNYNQELVVDFSRMMPTIPKAKVKSRIILSPPQAKRFMLALQENIKKYEAQHGTLKEGGSSMPPLSFNVPSAEA